jgi:glutaredoxin-dependent peroxiredoxin
MPIAVGSAAPDFVLKRKTADGALEDIRLSDSLGQRTTVLLFFPAVFSSVCTTEFCDVTSGLGRYEQSGARVIGISVDGPHAQQAWATAHKIQVPLASDLNKTVTRAYDVVLAGPAGEVSARAAFVIDRKGRVVYAEQTPTAKDLPNFAAILAAVNKAECQES